jgi:hypothetical protein
VIGPWQKGEAFETRREYERLEYERLESPRSELRAWVLRAWVYQQRNGSWIWYVWNAGSSTTPARTGTGGTPEDAMSAADAALEGM